MRTSFLTPAQDNFWSRYIFDIFWIFDFCFAFFAKVKIRWNACTHKAFCSRSSFRHVDEFVLSFVYFVAKCPGWLTAFCLSVFIRPDAQPLFQTGFLAPKRPLFIPPLLWKIIPDVPTSFKLKKKTQFVRFFGKKSRQFEGSFDWGHVGTPGSLPVYLDV